MRHPNVQMLKNWFLNHYKQVPTKTQLRKLKKYFNTLTRLEKKKVFG